MVLTKELVWRWNCQDITETMNFKCKWIKKRPEVRLSCGLYKGFAYVQMLSPSFTQQWQHWRKRQRWLWHLKSQPCKVIGHLTQQKVFSLHVCISCNFLTSGTNLDSAGSNVGNLFNSWQKKKKCQVILSTKLSFSKKKKKRIFMFCRKTRKWICFHKRRIGSKLREADTWLQLLYWM